MGLRERKKEQTRNALIDAALDLFLTQGYEATTVDQIAAEVDVSPRTFFRYFASKEEVALALPAEGQEIFLTELAARPESESPHAALSQAMRSMLGILRDKDPEEATRFTKAQQVIEATPALLAGQMCLLMENERKLVAEVARRQGTEPDDLRPQFVVSVFTGMSRVCFGPGPRDPGLVAKRLEDVLALAGESFRPGWDQPAGPPQPVPQLHAS
ncbi:TetR/AcrR family transcriptional regulator [Planotetraspora sp. GP83]|uniref:TetR/AcrR family transcriptional regulator n=1 Tax=Planotetraspora sp. GP83 TaxID=3156264 RepID=UPI0035184E0F